MPYYGVSCNIQVKMADLSRLHLRLDPDLINAIEYYRSQSDQDPGRSVIVRTLLREALRMPRINGIVAESFNVVNRVSAKAISRVVQDVQTKLPSYVQEVADGEV